MGLHRAGFEVFGVDIRFQPNYPFEFAVRDVTTITRVTGADFIWASPPCQAYTQAQRIQNRQHEALIGGLHWLLHASGIPYCIENVPGAPLRDPITLCGTMFGLRLYRHRLFECSFPISAPPHQEHVVPQVKMGRKPQAGEFVQVVGNFSDVAEGRRAMGIDWMTRDELRESIPPAYSEFVGRAAIQHIQQARAA